MFGIRNLVIAKQPQSANNTSNGCSRNSVAPPTSVSENPGRRSGGYQGVSQGKRRGDDEEIAPPDVALKLLPAEDADAGQQNQGEGNQRRHRRMQPVGKVGKPQEGRH